MKVTMTVLFAAFAGLTGQTYAASAPVGPIQVPPAASSTQDKSFKVAPGCGMSCMHPVVDEEEELSAAPDKLESFKVAPGCGTMCMHPVVDEEEELSAAPDRTAPCKVAPGGRMRMHPVVDEEPPTASRAHRRA